MKLVSRSSKVVLAKPQPRKTAPSKGRRPHSTGATEDIAGLLKDLRPLNPIELCDNQQAFMLPSYQRPLLCKVAKSLNIKVTTRRVSEDTDDLLVMLVDNS